tara:strand:- start:43 stop:432 length:390 start_codon:yes stop_codon:yes gene_type:complete
MASTVVHTKLRLDQTRNAALFANTETAVTHDSNPITMLNKFNCILFNRYAIQIFNSDASVAATVKVWGSLKDSPGSEAGSDWTQIGDDIAVGTSSNALKAISTTPIRHLCVTATGNGADLTVLVYGEQV